MDSTTESHPLANSPRYDVAVIGAGLAGLAAAATAARAGASTVLIDRRTVGGRARTVDRSGFLLNEGAHALYRTGRGQAVLDRLGVDLSGGAPVLSSYRVVWDGQVEVLPLTPKLMLSSRLLSSASKLKLVSWRNQMLHTERRDAAAGSASERSLEEWMDDERARPDLRRYLTVMARLTTYAADPCSLPVDAVLGQMGVSAGGVRYLDGGWQTIVDGLAGVCRRHAVRIDEHTTVTGLAPSPTGWTVAAGTGEVEASSVVLAVPPAVAAGVLGDDRAGWVERAGDPLRAACLDIGAAPGGLSFLLSADESLYLSQHAPVAALAPDGWALYSLMRYLGPDDDHAHDVSRALIERHARIAGVPEQRHTERFMASNVVAWGRPRMGVVRPSGDELAAHGVFAAGDWVGPAMLADAALDSGARAGESAARRAKVAT